MGEWAELIVHENMSVMADPNAIHDAAYVGHAANDGAMCASPEGQAAYERDSSAVANAELVPLDVAERDAQGQQQLVHLGGAFTPSAHTFYPHLLFAPLWGRTP